MTNIRQSFQRDATTTTDNLKDWNETLFRHKVGASQKCIFPGNSVSDSWQEPTETKDSLFPWMNLLILTNRIPHVQLDKGIMLFLLVWNDDSCSFAFKSWQQRENSKIHSLISFGKDYSFNTLFLFLWFSEKNAKIGIHDF